MQSFHSEDESNGSSEGKELQVREYYEDQKEISKEVRVTRDADMEDCFLEERSEFEQMPVLGIHKPQVQAHSQQVTSTHFGFGKFVQSLLKPKAEAQTPQTKKVMS